MQQGKMGEAEDMYLRGLARYEKAWGPDHKRTLDIRYNLADFFERKFMLLDAAKHFELVVQGYTKRLGPEHPETVDAFDRLKHCQGDSNDAVEDDKNDSDDAASVGAVTLLHSST